MRWLSHYLMTLFIGYTLLVGCKTDEPISTDQGVEKPTSPVEKPEETGPRYYRNPVFEPVLADPSVVFDRETGYFYGYGTEDDWGDGFGTRLVTMVRSKDLINWKVVGQAFQGNRPTWKKSGGIWAPDVVKVGDLYHLYYACSTWGDANPGIGVAVSVSPNKVFTDKGKIFDSNSIAVPNSIDPYYFEDNNKKYLFWGSFSSSATEGTYGVPLSADGLSVPDPKTKFKIAAGDFEAVVIHRRGEYYYFIGSKGSCCEGVNSTYRVMVARSKNLMGPYLDKNGNDVAQRGNGTLLLEKNEKFAGLGHTSRIITDSDGVDWIFYHGIDLKKGLLPNGASRRPLFLDKITWADEWPTIAGNTSSTSEQKRPVFKSK